MCNTFLEKGQIVHEDPTITNPDFPTQESGTSFMSPKNPYGWPGTTFKIERNAKNEEKNV